MGMKHRIAIGSVLIGVLICAPTFAMMNKVGTAGALFLKIGVDPRSSAMGEASGAVVGSAASAFGNPAGLAGITQKEIFVSDVEWIADIRLIAGCYAFPYNRLGVFAVSGVCVNYGEMPLVREAEADAVVGSFSPRDVAVGISYARRWTDRLMVGGSFKYIEQNIDDYRSAGVAFDFGTVYYTGFRSLRLAMSTNNFGPDMQFDGIYLDKYYIGTAYVETEKAFGEYDLPLNFRIALAYDFYPSENSRLTAALDATHPNDYSERLHIGCEYCWEDLFAIRSGYVINGEEVGFSAGCGLKLSTSAGKGWFDYAYTDLGVFQGVHRIGFGLSF